MFPPLANTDLIFCGSCFFKERRLWKIFSLFAVRNSLMKNPSGFLIHVFFRRCNFDTELGQLILTHFFSFPKTLTCTLDMSILVTSSPHAALQIFPLSLSRLGDSPDEESLRRSSTAEPRQIKVFELIFCSIFSNLSLTLANNCEAAEAPSVSTGTPLGV